MGMKTQLLLLVVQLGSVFSHYEKYPLEKGVHVIDKGERQQGDDTLYSETLIERGDSYGDGDEYCYPPRGSIDQIKITEYEVKDQDTGNDGGLAFEISGGQGQSQVCFALRSRHGRSYRYKVEVYGFRLNNGMMRLGNVGGFGAAGNAGIGTPLGGMGSGYGGVGGNLGVVGSGYGGNGLGGAGFGYAANQAGGYGAAVPPYGIAGVNPLGINGIPTYGNTGVPFGNTGVPFGNTGVPYGSGNFPNGQGTPYGSNAGSGNLYGPNSRGPFNYGDYPRKK